MRLFTAIKLPDDIIEVITVLQPEISRYLRVKDVKRENLHLTLKFLGEFDDARLGDLIHSLSMVSLKPFKVELAGLGCFPLCASPRIVWVGCVGGSGEVESLHAQIESATLGFGFSEDHRFHPHITLARVKSAFDLNGFRSFLGEHAGSGFGSFQVECFQLFKSTLSPNGPSYFVVEEYPLG